MRYLSVFSFCLITACASAPDSPEIINITLSSIQPGLADETIIGSGDHSESYKVPGFLIDFTSSHKIQDSRFGNNNFWGVDFFRCDTSEPTKVGGSSSNRGYTRIYYGTHETKYVMQLDKNRYLYRSNISQSTVDNVQRLQESSQICMAIFIPHEEKFKGMTQAKVISNHLALEFPKNNHP